MQAFRPLSGLLLQIVPGVYHVANIAIYDRRCADSEQFEPIVVGWSTVRDHHLGRYGAYQYSSAERCLKSGGRLSLARKCSCVGCFVVARWAAVAIDGIRCAHHAYRVLDLSPGREYVHVL